MSDWDFLHDMYNDGYNPDQIADAVTCGYNPWEWQPLDETEFSSEQSEPDPELATIFENLVENTAEYHALTGRYLQIWGELGELYAEIEYGIKRHKPHATELDGKLGNDFIEIKTISPEKGDEQVQVKSAGNFNKLLVVKISEDFTFEGHFIGRKRLSKGNGAYARVSWVTLTAAEKTKGS